MKLKKSVALVLAGVLQTGALLLAYGFYVRHADGVRLENVRLRYADGREERPAVVTDDADVTLVGCDFMNPQGTLPTVLRR